jgi:NAD(P)-dependent dehydrogenase (short-subunit alcohol dehydrogenase family)
VVTGGARGCGLSFAQGLAEAGANVVVLDLIDPEPEFHEISTKYSVNTWYFKVDVSSVSSLEKVFSTFLQETGGALDICIACAGTNKNLSFTKSKCHDHVDRKQPPALSSTNPHHATGR